MRQLAHGDRRPPWIDLRSLVDVTVRTAEVVFCSNDWPFRGGTKKFAVESSEGLGQPWYRVRASTTQGRVCWNGPRATQPNDDDGPRRLPSCAHLAGVAPACVARGAMRGSTARRRHASGYFCWDNVIYSCVSLARPASEARCRRSSVACARATFLVPHQVY